MKKTAFLTSLFVAVISFILFSHSQEKNLIWDGSRTVPVHYIPLKDELDQPIIPTETYPLPYSSRFTCAPCHNYDTINKGFHFNAAATKEHGRAGEPWILIDQETGTILPLSYRSWKGMWHPKDIGLSFWDFSLLFSRHMTGGGISEPGEDEESPKSRWETSGKLEINCLGCHSGSRLQNHSEWAIQVLRHNFRWAATAASGLGEVGGMASRLPPTWDIYDGPNPDDKEYAIVPSVIYRRSLFDSKHRVFFDIATKPEDRLCITCHSVSPAGTQKYMLESDIHSASGLKCIDCHRNSITHQIIRGYEGEADEQNDPVRNEFTCKGCHLGQEFPKNPRLNSGRFGAPYPLHKGIPEVHFEKMSCTVCHAGPLPRENYTRVMTSRANRLGIFGIARWYTDMPYISEPVYIKDENGMITPHRLMWPAFWGEFKGKILKPLKPEKIKDAGSGILDVENRIAAILLALSLTEGLEGSPLLLYSGNSFERNADGRLSVFSNSSETPDDSAAWLFNKNNTILPLIPDFDPSAEEQDPDIEMRIQNILTALLTVDTPPGSPVFLHRNFLYKLVGGYLDKSNYTEEKEIISGLAWESDKGFESLVSPFHLQTIYAVTGKEQTLTEEQVKRLLNVLAQRNTDPDSNKSKYFYISSGKMFTLNEKGKLQKSDHSAAAPVVWPLGHQVRPAQQSLGTGGCIDCHTVNSPFFFNTVKGTGPLITQASASRSASSFMSLDKPYQKIFGLSFSARPVLKFILIIAAVVIALFILIIVLLFLGKKSGLLNNRSSR